MSGKLPGRDTPDFNGWEGITDGKKLWQCVGYCLVYLSHSYPFLIAASMGLAAVAGLILYFNPNQDGIAGAVAIGLLMAWLAIGFRSMSYNAENSKKQEVENQALESSDDGTGEETAGKAA